MSYTLSEVEHIMIEDLNKRFRLMLDCDLGSVDFPYKKLMNHMLQMIDKNRMFAINALKERDYLQKEIIDAVKSILKHAYDEDSYMDHIDGWTDQHKLDYINEQCSLLGLVKRKD